MEGNCQYIQHNTHTDREEDQGTMTLPLQLFREFLEQPVSNELQQLSLELINVSTSFSVLLLSGSFYEREDKICSKYIFLNLLSG